MKFLKTFLFSISLIFLSFGIVTLKGFCASVALDTSISPTVNSNINQFSSFAITPEYMAIYGPAYLDELNTQLYQSYGWDLETLSWYGEDRFKGYMFGQEQNPLNSTDLSPQIANAISNRMMTGTIETIVTAKSLYDNGYNYFSTAIPQWGNNAKQWILGKIDSVTGKISEVGSNAVTKITQEGLSNYFSIYNDMVTDGIVDNITNRFPIKSKVLSCFGVSDWPIAFSLNVDQDLIFYSYGDSSITYPKVCVLVPETLFDSSSRRILVNASGIYFVDSMNSSTPITNLYIDTPYSVVIDNVTYYYGQLRLNDGSYGWVPRMYYLGNLNQAKTLIGSQGSTALSYDYSSSWSSAIESQLDRLIGKYVDSISLKRIQDIVNSIPIGVENVGGVDVPVAIPTQSIIDSLTSAVDDAVALDPDYSAVFEDADAVVVEPEPEPIPSGDYGLVIPDDFPIDTVSPILDSVYLPSHFFSIFEPLFSVFGQHQTLLLNSWYVIPSFLIVLALFGLVL